MSLPTRTDILLGDYSFFGIPYLDTYARSDIDTLDLDYSFFGVPFIAANVDATVTTEVVYNCIFFGSNF